MKRALLILLLPVLMAFTDTPLADPALEARARALMDEIRCVACENEPISQSGADIASDMRERVRLIIKEGGSDAEVRAWFADRYGEFVLFRPPTTGTSGLLLWGLPFGGLLFGGLALVLAVRRMRKSSDDDVIVPVAPESIDGAFDHDSGSEN